MHRIAIDDVLALLTPEQVIAACGLDARQRGRAYRLRTCPGCGARPSREGAAIYRRPRDHAWRWTHHGHACGGDLLDLLAASEGIDRRRELPRLLERAAPLAGIAPTDPDLERRIAESIARAAAEREQEERDRAAALAAMPGTWDRLATRSLVGERYLASRGIDPAALRDIVRYTESGELAVPMRHLDTGEIVGIQYRAPAGKGFRTEPHSDPSESALVGRLTDLDPDGVDVAVIVEGLADTLAAHLAWPGCAVYGAAGAGHLETIAEAVASRVAACRGWLLVVPDDDPTGTTAAADAVRAAESDGLGYVRLDEQTLDGAATVRLVDIGEHHDLADAWRAGWRYRWPTRWGATA